MENKRGGGDVFSLTVGVLTTLAVVLGLEGCQHRERGGPRILVPQNVRLVINEGAFSTNDTALRVSISGDFIYQMKVGWSERWPEVDWRPYASQVRVDVPHREGSVSVWGQFTSAEGGTTDVVVDDILLDFTALIHQFEVIAPRETLEVGDRLEFLMETGEGGWGFVSLEEVESPYTLHFNPPGSFSGLWIVPRGLPSTMLTITAHFIDQAGNNAPPALWPDTLTILGDTLRLRSVAQLRIPDTYLQDMFLDQGYAILSDSRGYLHIIDIRTPQFPQYVKRVLLLNARGMAKEGDLLFVAAGEGGVAVFSYRTPVGISTPMRIPVGGIVEDVEVSGEFLYAGTLFDGIWTMRVGQLGEYQLLSHTRLTGYVERLIRYERNLLAIGHYGVALIDLTDPAAPRLKWEKEVREIPKDGVIIREFLVLATREEGLLVYNLQNPNGPELIARHRHLGSPHALLWVSPFLFSGDDSTLSVSLGGSLHQLKRIQRAAVRYPSISLQVLTDRWVVVGEREGIEIFWY